MRFPVALAVQEVIIRCNFKINRHPFAGRLLGNTMEIERGAGKIAKCLRLMLVDKPGHLASVATAVAKQNASVGDIHLLRVGRTHNTREIVIYVDSDQQFEDVIDALTGSLSRTSLIWSTRYTKVARYAPKAE